MNNQDHIPEEKLIDFALGNASEEQQENIRQHTKRCEQCEKQLKEWFEMLSKHTNVKPSEELKEKVWRNTHNQSSRVKKKRKKVMLTALSSAAAVFLLYMGLQAKYIFDENTYQVSRNEEIQKQTILTMPQTKQLAVVPVAEYHDIRGNLWINDDTQELLLEVDGLETISNRDYQLWIIYENNDIRGEVLSTIDGFSRVLITGKDVNQFKIIKASLEPRGGSQQPTGPETFIVPLLR